VVDLRGEHLPVKLSRDPWYAFNPVFSPDGARIAWQEWDECDMPWDQSRLLVARLAGPTRDAVATADIRAAATATLSRPGVSYASPTFSPDGQHLAFTSDETGWRSLWVGDADGQSARRIDTGAGEIGLPDWLPRMSRISWRGDGREILAVRRAASRDTLLRVAWPEGTCSATEAQVSSISYFASGEDQVAIVGSSPTRPPNLALIDLASGQSRMLATGAVGLIDAASLAAAEQISFSTAGGATAWGNLYSAVGPAAASNPRPLIISVHGGPTSERSLAWDAEAQYFATRGWHYFQLNHRGGSGFGRAVQDALRCQWGVVDVEDARAAAEHLIRLGLADRGRLVITGGSAGGYTTLMALTRDPDLWAAGVSLFGIGDLYELKQGSHRFEVNYELGLVGPLPETGPRWVERSPLSHVDRVRAPVLLFHGTEDKAVPHQQSVDFAEAVRRRGGVAELVSYEGEGHGFRKESNRRDLVERTERFLDKYVLCRQHAAAGG
jgi:dipeptidyl aminopeptidase/acylaminoacyl peptidase